MSVNVNTISFDLDASIVVCDLDEKYWTGDCVSDTKDRLLETEENVGSSNKIGKHLFIPY